MKTLIDDTLPKTVTPTEEKILTPEVETLPAPKEKNNTALNLLIIAGVLMLLFFIFKNYVDNKDK